MEGRSRGEASSGDGEDAVICHGASKFMLDRMFYNSDKYFVPVCLNCGSIAIPKTNRAYGVSVHRQDWCPMCERRSRVKRVRMPYATKLCLQELMALHVMPRVRLSNHSKIFRSLDLRLCKKKKKIDRIIELPIEKKKKMAFNQDLKSFSSGLQTPFHPTVSTVL